MQVCTSLQTDNHASTSPLSFLQARCPSCRPTNSGKALKSITLVTLIIVVVACVLHSRYQPVWMTDVGVASNIIMSTISSPYLFVLDPQTHEFYLLDESTAQHPTIDAVADFLDDISNGSRQVASLLAAASTVHFT